ncbi:15747_t:CDS:2, partial [Racocetra fulgida]
DDGTKILDVLSRKLRRQRRIVFPDDSVGSPDDDDDDDVVMLVKSIKEITEHKYNRLLNTFNHETVI